MTKKTVVEESRTVKSSGRWVSYILALNIEGKFFPLFRLDIEGPHVIEVQTTEALATEDYEVGIDEFTGMVGSLPRRRSVVFGQDSSPDFSLPVQDADIVESDLFIGASSEEDELLLSIVEV
jgi:hypothetical protein